PRFRPADDPRDARTRGAAVRNGRLRDASFREDWRGRPRGWHLVGSLEFRVWSLEFSRIGVLKAARAPATSSRVPFRRRECRRAGDDKDATATRLRAADTGEATWRAVPKSAPVVAP